MRMTLWKQLIKSRSTENFVTSTNLPLSSIRKSSSKIEERLSTVRWDKTRPVEDMKRDVVNLVREHSRLQAIIDVLRIKADTHCEQSVRLDLLGLPPSLQDDEYRPLESTVTMDSSISNIRVESELDLIAELESQKFMRTKSTGSVKEQQPKQKWDSMFKMFKEWKGQKHVAAAQRVVTDEHHAPQAKPVSTQKLQDEIATLRNGIRNLRSKKELSKSDQAMLTKMTRRLKELTQS